MPKRPSTNVKGKYIELRPDLAQGMEELARRNGRTFREEVEHAFERHLANPPVVTVQVTVPDLPPVTIEVKAEPTAAGKPARKRKKSG
jgi:hypothetical protein